VVSTTHAMTYSTRNTCRVCGSRDLEELFSLGSQFVSDFVKVQPSDDAKVPIDVVQCRKCALVQQRHTSPSDFMYTRHYWYRSGTTDKMRKHLHQLAQSLLKYVEPEDLVLDIGSNDGTFLRAMKFGGCRSAVYVGVEPATNLVEEGRRGIDLLVNDFWSVGALGDLRSMKFKVVTALGMFYDLEDPNQFIRDVAHVLHKDGVFVAQLMCAHNMYQMCDVGNLCHEHLEFYTLRSLDYLFDQHGLEIFDVETNDCNGQSYRLFVRHKANCGGPGDVNVQLARGAEREVGEPRFWRDWYRRLIHERRMCFEFVDEANQAGKSVWVYGASTKGNTILQWYGLDNDLIDGAVDKSAEKHGKRTVGTDIPIHDEEYGRKRADYFLVLPYAFVDEFKLRERDWLAGGGTFLVPLPKFEVLK
jgi:NDP-4-keto-2,6-dideoxyhexose 3-C-methyltransferase